MSNDDPQTEKYDYWFNFDSWYAITISFALWALMYQALIHYLPRNTEYCNRITSFVHGVLTAFVGINQCFLIDSPFYHPEWRTTRSQKFLMACSLGYFIHDLIWCWIYQRESKLMIAHHSYSVIALYRMLYSDYSGAQATCSLGTMEITNPMLQMRWFIRSEGYYPSTLYTSVEITFMLLFFFVRIFLGTYYIILILLQPKNDWEWKILALTIYIMSWMFMINILKYFSNKYGGINFLHPVMEINSKGT